MVAHAKSAGVKINEFERVGKMELKGESKRVHTEKAVYEAER